MRQRLIYGSVLGGIPVGLGAALASAGSFFGESSAPIQKAGLFSTGLPDFTELAEKLKPVVVNISTKKTVKRQRPQMPGMPPGFGPQDPFDDFFKHFFGDQPPVERSQQSL